MTDGGSLKGVAYVFSCDGTDWTEDQILMPNDKSQKRFGSSVSIFGDAIAIGAESDFGAGRFSGAAYVFRKKADTWVQEQKFTGSDTGEHDLFGKCIALGDGLIIAGVEYKNESEGVAYIFRYDGVEWKEEIKLTVGRPRANFGSSVAISGNAVAVGAPYDGPAVRGSVSLYRYDGMSWVLKDTLAAQDWYSYDYFGDSVSMDGNRLFVGADGDDDLGDHSGSAYMFENDGTQWDQGTKLTLADHDNRGNLGRAVAIDGDVALLGAPGDSRSGVDCGSAYFSTFDGTSWNDQVRIAPADGMSGDFFGAAVSIDGDTAIIGAMQNDEIDFNAGAAYVYRNNGIQWLQEKKLLASDGSMKDRFGCSVSIKGSLALVGARGDAEVVANGGSAYVFRRSGNNWFQEAKIVPPAPNEYEEFGSSVSLGEDIAVIGAYGKNTPRRASGAVYVYRFDGTGWIYETMLWNPDGADYDHFGCSVAVDNDIIIVGAELETAAGNRSGAAYVYRYDGSQWQLHARLLPADADDDGRFGYSVAIKGDKALIGTGLSVSTGGAYVFHLIDDVWVEKKKLIVAGDMGIDRFGDAVALSDNVALIGARHDSQTAYQAGAGYVFRLICPPADLTDDCFVDLRDLGFIASQWLQGMP